MTIHYTTLYIGALIGNVGMQGMCHAAPMVQGGYVGAQASEPMVRHWTAMRHKRPIAVGYGVSIIDVVKVAWKTPLLLCVYQLPCLGYAFMTIHNITIR